MHFVKQDSLNLNLLKLCAKANVAEVNFAEAKSAEAEFAKATFAKARYAKAMVSKAKFEKLLSLQPNLLNLNTLLSNNC